MPPKNNTKKRSTKFPSTDDVVVVEHRDFPLRKRTKPNRFDAFPANSREDAFIKNSMITASTSPSAPPITMKKAQIQRGRKKKAGSRVVLEISQTEDLELVESPKPEGKDAITASTSPSAPPITMKKAQIQRGRKKKAGSRVVLEISQTEDLELVESPKPEGKDAESESETMSNEIYDNDIDAADDEDADRSQSKYHQGQKVLARDQDGILYQAFVRRTLYGQSHRKQLQVGMASSQEELQLQLDQLEQESPKESWHYFLHYLNWKANWDRWAAESDLMELTDENIVLQQRILQEHRALQNQFKTKKKTTSGRKIDGVTFLKAWKQKLDVLLGLVDDPVVAAQKRKVRAARQKKSQQNELKQLHQLQSQQLLTNRTTVELHAIALGSGLKRVLVEEWEILSHFPTMVHPLPAKVTVRDALDQYLEAKGIPLDIVQRRHLVKKTTNKKVAETKVEDSSDIPPIIENSSTVPVAAEEGSFGDGTTKSDLQFTGDTRVGISSSKNTQAEEISADKMETDADPSTPLTTSINIAQALDDERQQEWIDTANGICLLFDQALAFRLLYPCEESQLAVLEQEPELVDLPKSEIYGCEHLLRLICQLPALLQEQYADKEDSDEILKPIFAKVNDFCRHLAKHQDALVAGNFEKKTTTILQVEQRWAKRLERKRAAAAASATEDLDRSMEVELDQALEVET